MTAAPDLRSPLRRQLDAAHLALTFLTALPLPPTPALREGDFVRASGYYPLSGYVIGGVVSLLLWLPLPLPAGVTAALAVAAWLWITGMLHFDGLVDSADALLMAGAPERRLDILKDVHVGAFGLAAGCLTLLVLWSLLGAGLPAYAPVVAAVSARWLMLLPINLYPAARQGSLGAQSRGGPLLPAFLLALPALLLPGAWIAALAALLGMLLLARFAAGRLGGGLNGDVYGLLIVAGELLALCTYAWGRG